MIVIISINCSTIEIETTTNEKLATAIKEEEKELKLNREKLKREKELLKTVKPTDVIELNVGGELIAITRQSITRIPKSVLSTLFNGRWEHKLDIDNNGNICLDFHPTLFRHLLDQLQSFHSNNSIQLIPPSQPSLVEPFKNMLGKLGLHELLSSERKNVITLNVGGQTITNRRQTLAEVSNSTFDTIVLPSARLQLNDQNDAFVDYDPSITSAILQ